LYNADMVKLYDVDFISFILSFQSLNRE